MGTRGSAATSKVTARKIEQRMNQTESSLFCSDMYTPDFILREMSKIKANENIVKVNIEDLILNGNPVIMKSATEFLVETAATIDNYDAAEKRGSNHREQNPSRGKSILPRQSKRKENKVETLPREWQSIIFLDSISSAQDYQDYLEMSKEFGTSLQRHLAMKNLTLDMPICVETKIEIRNTMDVVTIVQCLQEVSKDKSLSRMEFPDFPSKDKRGIAKEFIKMINPESMEWDGYSIEILLFYHQQKKKQKKGDDLNKPHKIIAELLKEIHALTEKETLGKSNSTALTASNSSSIRAF